MKSSQLLTFFILATLLMLVVAVFIIVMLIAYRSRQDKFQMEQEKLKTENDNKILIAQIEARELTMTNLSLELHDNISQLLYLVQTNMKVIAREHTPQVANGLISNTTEILETIVRDIQSLGRSLNGEFMKDAGLVTSLKKEIERLNYRWQLTITINIEGSPFKMPDEKEIVLFRIAQETIHNTLKHAKATHLDITLSYLENAFTMKMADNGKGFVKNDLSSLKGMGLSGMHHRARLIGADLQIVSAEEKGTLIAISISNPCASE